MLLVSSYRVDSTYIESNLRPKATHTVHCDQVEGVLEHQDIRVIRIALGYDWWLSEDQCRHGLRVGPMLTYHLLTKIRCHTGPQAMACEDDLAFCR